MALYPKQLQYYTQTSLAAGPGDSKVKVKTNGTEVVKASGTVSGDINVNDLLHLIGQKLYGTSLGSVRNDPRVRPFDTDFGNVVIYAQDTVLAEDITVNGAIFELRGKWDTLNPVAANRIRKATSVLH